VTNCTNFGNTASASGPWYGDGGGISNDEGTLTVANTIVAGNTASNSGPDVSGAVTSLGYNLIGNPSGGSGFVATDLQGLDPLLGPLQSNGGPTQTLALLPGSPAIDAGSNALVPAGLATDQRGPGFARFCGAAVDIGAFEYQTPVATINGPSTDPEGTAVTFTSSFTDGATAIGPYNFTWHVTAGNGQSIADQTGTVSAPGSVPSLTFTPADDGAYTVTLTVTDRLNLTGTQSAALTATNVAPTATITGLGRPHPLFILAGDGLTLSGNFSDPGVLDHHTVTWNFGDGSSTTTAFGAGGSALFSANHAFAAPGTYVVTLTVTDDDDGIGTAQMTVIVQTPAGATGSLISYVQSLPGLNAGQQNSLVSTLNAVIDSLKRGNTTAAKNQLGAFENKIKAFFQAGLLTQAQESFLLSSADAIEQGIG
jgi:hypothetical protein